MSERTATTRRQFGAGRALNSYVAESKGSDPKFTRKAMQSFHRLPARRAELNYLVTLETPRSVGCERQIPSGQKKGAAILADERMSEPQVYLD
jgi:hypothetical protein